MTRLPALNTVRANAEKSLMNKRIEAIESFESLPAAVRLDIESDISDALTDDAIAKGGAFEYLLILLGRASANGDVRAKRIVAEVSAHYLRFVRDETVDAEQERLQGDIETDNADTLYYAREAA